MTFDPTSHLGPVANVLTAISERQKVTSNNIANAHTPGYSAKEVSFSDLLTQMNSPFETQLSKKMGSNMTEAGPFSTGQAVDLQKELIEMQRNMLFYSVATRRASTIFNTLRTASQIGR